MSFAEGHSNCKEQFGYKALIENGFPVITPSRPGYRGTSKEIGQSISVASEYYMKLLNQLKINKVYLHAISADGASGIIFAATYPKKVCSLTFWERY